MNFPQDGAFYKRLLQFEMSMDEKKSFPDLTGDGKVTKADILKGRGVDIKEEKPQMFATGGSINPELRKKVEQFVKGVAKYYDYSVDDAYLAIMTILKGGIVKEEVNEGKSEVILSNQILDFLQERDLITGINAQKVHKELTAFIKNKIEYITGKSITNNLPQIEYKKD